jgi:hypothetical protein
MARMLQSMKKGDPKVPSLSKEAKAKQDNIMADIKAKVAARVKNSQNIDLVKVRDFKPADAGQENTFEGVAKDLAYQKQRQTQISERRSNDYGRNTPKGQDPYYNREELEDDQNEPYIKKAIESLRAKRAKMEEDYKAKTKPKK